MDCEERHRCQVFCQSWVSELGTQTWLLFYSQIFLALVLQWDWFKSRNDRRATIKDCPYKHSFCVGAIPCGCPLPLNFKLQTKRPQCQIFKLGHFLIDNLNSQFPWFEHFYWLVGTIWIIKGQALWTSEFGLITDVTHIASTYHSLCNKAESSIPWWCLVKGLRGGLPISESVFARKNFCLDYNI